MWVLHLRKHQRTSEVGKRESEKDCIYVINGGHSEPNPDRRSFAMSCLFASHLVVSVSAIFCKLCGHLCL